MRSSGGEEAAPVHSARWQATQCPGLNSRHRGSSRAQRSTAIGQRVRKRQPEGGLAGLGTSPVRMMRSRLASSSGSWIGTADSSAWV